MAWKHPRKYTRAERSYLAGHGPLPPLETPEEIEAKWERNRAAWARVQKQIDEIMEGSNETTKQG